MDNLFNILRKTLVGTIVLVFAFVVTYTPQQYNKVNYAEAIPVTEVGPSGVANLNTAVQTTTTAVKEITLDAIGFILAKTLISKMLSSMVTWINSGFEGSPAFVQDLGRFLLDAADEAAGEYIRGLGDIGSFLCSPFRLDIQLALSLRYQQSRESGGGVGGGGNRRDSCDLSDIVTNVEGFFEGTIGRDNFWEQWVEVSSRPQRYTPYGQMIEAEAQLDAVISNSQGQSLEILRMGDGFLSNEICEIIEGPTTPAAGANGDSTASPAPSRRHCVISTPGRVISEQLNKALGAGQDQLVAADELNEVISALIGQLANQALMGTAGLLGLSPRTGHTASGYGAGSYVDELVRETRRSAEPFIADGYEQITTKLALQEEYGELAVRYIPRLNAVINNRLVSAELRARAQTSYNDAIVVKDTTAIHIAKLRPLVTEFEALQAELGGASVTESRRQAIATRQTQIINEGVIYRAYTEDRMQVSSREWSEIAGN